MRSFSEVLGGEEAEVEVDIWIVVGAVLISHLWDPQTPKPPHGYPSDLIAITMAYSSGVQTQGSELLHPLVCSLTLGQQE